ncbi:MAG TPA: NAD(P)/FAD-dependent oxidoreductase [Gaiellaceae bacterium]|nr:NAD(P)/FAD-dependent oxidoreductase [Gaiellaceae bacterium]
MSEAERVVIVGAGAAGLSTAAALTQRGVDALVLDRSDRIGGSWVSRYERLHLHTIRRFSGLAHHGIPGRYPRYLSKDEYAAYLGEYAERFGLRIALGEEVTSIHAPASGALLWQIETARRTIAAEVVIVASGHYAEPRIPDWEGIHEFGGRLLHSAAYRTGREFAGMRALVVGLGNSGAEIATDLVEQGAGSVAVAVRTPPPIVTREMFGVVPVQLFGIVLMPLGFPRTVDRIAAVLRRRTVGDLRPYGIDEAAWGPFTARRPAVIDVGFLDVLKAGRVTVRPALTRLTREGGEFADGSSGDFDVVVAATGFGTGLEKTLRGVAGVVSEDGQPLSRSGQPTAADGLYFIGFDETIRGHLFEARRESTRLARRVAGSLTTPAGTSSA